MTTNPQQSLAGLHGDEFHTVWVTVGPTATADTYKVDLYLNGSTTPLTIESLLQPPSSNLTDNNPGFGDAITNFMTIGLVNTNADASIEIDYVAWKSGVIPPVARTCGSGGVPFIRGDSDSNGKIQLTDAVSTLKFLFLGGETPKCKEAADSDGSGKLQLTDAVFELNWLFLGTTVLPPPGKFCGLPDSYKFTEPCVYTCPP